MTAISATSASTQQQLEALGYGSPAPTPPDEFAAGLSPDALMAYCQARLDSIDGQVKTSFDDQKQSANEINQINGALAALKPYASDGTTDPQVCAQLENAIGSMIMRIKQSDPNSPALPTLTQAYNTMVWSGTGGDDGPQFIDRDKYPPQHMGDKPDNHLGPDEIQSYIQSLTDATSTLNSNSELEMVNLQSLMSQRETAVTLTTNLVQSLGEQETKIAGNIGH